MGRVLKSSSMISIATAIVLSMTGCGGGGGSSTTTGGTTATTVNGTVSDGYISGAMVCYDMNGNNKCDNHEPSTVTDVNGSYELNVSAADKENADKNASLLVYDGIDIDTEANLTGTFKAPFNGSAATATAQITPLTTLVSAMVAKGTSVDTAYKQVAKALGLTEAEVKSDPVKLAKDNNNTKVIQTAMTIHRVITTMAKSADVNNSKIYSDLVTAIKTVAANSNATKSIATIVKTAASEQNSTLPKKAKDAAQVANIIETTISDAITGSTNIQNAALVSDAAVDNIQKGLEANKTIKDIENNATITRKNAKPINLAVKNILNSYLDTTISDANITTIANNFTSSSNVSVEKIIELDGINSTIKSNLKKAYTAQQIKLYVEKKGQVVTDSEVAEIASISGIDYNTLKTMSLADFSKKIYNSGNSNLMSLSLKLSPPASIASMSDIKKAKAMFTSVRTQVNQANNFTQNESTKIDTALNSVSNSVTFTTAVFNTINDMVAQVEDTNTSAVSRLVDGGDRNITVSKNTSSGNNNVWNYAIKDTNGTNSWSGSLTYTNNTFDPSNFTTLTAELTGTMPIDFYGATIPTGKTNSQNLDANVKITKTTNGAAFKINANITNNSDSLKITDANLVVVYDVNSTTKKLLAKYVKLQNLYVNGTVGDYTLDGKLDVKSYAINKIGEAKGFYSTTTYNWFSIDAKCPNDGNVTNPILFKNMSANYTSKSPTDINVWYDRIEGNLTPDDLINKSNYTGIPSDCNLSLNDFHSWTEDDDFQNSGYYPSEITFDGTLTDNNTSAYLNAKIDAKWTNIVDADLNSNKYKPNLNVVVDGTLQMPSSEPMKVNLNYSNIGAAQNITATYVNGNTSITANTAFSDDNGTKVINLSSTAGIKSTITLNGDNKVDYAKSTVTNTKGDTVATIEDRDGTPVVKYADGTFDSLY